MATRQVPPSAAKRLLRALGSVKFTLLLLALSALALAAGTLVERREGARAARSLVYQSAWFQAALFLMAVNLVAAVLKRFPLKKRHIPFVITHGAIVLLLAGAWITRAFGVEGRMAIREGEKEDRIYLEDLQVEARWEAPPSGMGRKKDNLSPAWDFPIPSDRDLQALPLQEESAGRPALWVAHYLPSAVPWAKLVPGGDQDPPAVEFLIAGKGLHGFQWVLANHPLFRRKHLGPLEVEILLARDEGFFRERKKALDRRPRLVEILPGKGLPPVRIPLPEGLGKPFSCGGGVTARVKRFFTRARVGDQGLEDDPSAPVNPAALVEIRKGNNLETHTVFSLFPEFSVARGIE